jgi:hypothetical protein
MNKFFPIFLTLMAFTGSVQAQEDTMAVQAPIKNLFTAMATADTTLLRSCFADSAILQTIALNKEGKAVVRNESIVAFAKSISSYPKGSLDERISFSTVQIDGALAAVWTPYSFYFNGNFSHCGVNAFHLVKSNGAWKIQYIIDTRRKVNCIAKSN